jgi:myo-inositol 2-dehydrogenase/D-chiro-inositol 1-dehydrogenase
LADALLRPDFRSRGLLDTAIVSVRFHSGALATADGSFLALCGYDVRAEGLRRGGMVRVGIQSPINLVHHTSGGSTKPRMNWFGDACVAALAHFVACVRSGGRRAAVRMVALATTHGDRVLPIGGTGQIVDTEWAQPPSRGIVMSR